MLDEGEFQRWQEAAAVAERAMSAQADAKLYNWACFLAEQSAQLAVKGLLRGLGAPAWGHDLVELGSRLAEATGERLEPRLASALQRLSRHYIPPRYPDAYASGSPAAHYGEDDAAEARRDLAAVLAYAHETWASLVAASSEEGRVGEAGEGGWPSP
jgi:HEPN domain-containing protein